MRPVRIYAAAAGPTAWKLIDYMQTSFAIGFRCTVQEGSTLTYSVQHGFSDLLTVNGIAMTRSGTTATMTWPTTAYGQQHGLSVGDSIVNSGYGAPFDGTFTLLTVASGSLATFAVANSGPTASDAGQTQRIFVGNHSVVTGLSASSDGNYAFPPNYVRLNVTAYTSGAVTMSFNQGDVS